MVIYRFHRTVNQWVTGSSPATTIASSSGSSASPDGLFGFQQRAPEQAKRQKIQETTPAKEESAQETVKRRGCILDFFGNFVFY